MKKDKIFYPYLNFGLLEEKYSSFEKSQFIILPAPFGHLSGCTYSEGGSWGKVDLGKLEEGKNFAEVLADATIAWPLILIAVMQRLKRKRIVKKIFR